MNGLKGEIESPNAPAGGLYERLLKAGWTFDFFQAVWLLERLCPGKVGVGRRGPAAAETLLLRPAIELAFPASDVRTVQRLVTSREGAPRHLLETTFMGLYGVDTPLPLHYATEMLRRVHTADRGTEPAKEHDPVLPDSCPARDVLDLLHHRLLSLLYRAWLKYRYQVAFGRPGQDEISRYLLWFIGCDPDWSRADVGVEPVRLLRYAGAFNQQPRSAAMLGGIIADYWGDVPVSIDQAVGRWTPIAAADENRLGRANSRLGEDLTLGTEVYDLCGTFRIRLGPVDWDGYIKFLPDSERFAQTRALVETFLPDPLACLVELHLKPGCVPPLEIRSDDRSGRLGLTTWMYGGPAPEVSVSFQTRN